MPTFHYETEYKLDRAHFNECFEQSVPSSNHWMRYSKCLMFVVIAVALFFAPISRYLVYFFIGLSAVEALSVYFKQSWWVLRQLVGKAANHMVCIQINDNGIHIESEFVEQQILWADITNIKITGKGLLISQQHTTHYISQSCLSIEAIQFITAHRQKI